LSTDAERCLALVYHCCHHPSLFHFKVLASTQRCAENSTQCGSFLSHKHYTEAVECKLSNIHTTRITSQLNRTASHKADNHFDTALTVTIGNVSRSRSRRPRLSRQLL